MHDVLPLVFGYLRGIWRYRWYMLVEVWVICLIGWVMVLKLPNVYEASAKVYVDTKSMLKPLLSGLTVQSDVQEQAVLMTQRLLSRENLDKVIRATDLDLTINSDAEKESMIKGLEKRIKIRRSGGHNLYTITYQHTDPQKTRDVVNALLKSFEDGLMVARRDDTSRAQQFLEEQISQYESRLEEAEQLKKEFKQRYINVLSSKDNDYYGRLERAKADLTMAQLNLTESQRRRQELRRQINGEAPTFGFSEPTLNGKTSAIQARIDKLETKLDNLLLQFTPVHPDVIALQNTIEELEKQKQDEMSKQSSLEVPVDDLDRNPVHQRMKIALSEVEADIATLSVRVNEYRRRVRSLEDKMHTIPEVEAEYSKINRDYDTIKRNYEALLARRESALISQEVAKNEDKVNFQPIEQPVVPSVPVSPNRPVFLTGVLVVSLGLGVALAFFIAQIRPTFDSRRNLSLVTGLPVLGSVSLVLDKQQQRRRNFALAYFGIACIALLGAFALVQASVMKKIDLPLYFSQVVELSNEYRG